jgi:hypothetical protein
VGLYEGEGCLGAQKWKKKYKDRVYEGAQIYLTIKMVDEDVIARAANFLKIKYHIADQKYTESKGRKTLYRVRKCGGINGELRDLLDKMYPHLSKRRQKQIDDKLDKANALFL